MISEYAKSIGVTEADAHTARNIHLSVADCRHLRRMLDKLKIAVEHGDVDISGEAEGWNIALREYLKTAV